MAAQKRRANPALADELFSEPYRFSFFQAVRLLERLAPDRQPVGRSRQAGGHASHPTREIVRFCTIASLVFPPSQISELKKYQPGESDQVKTHHSETDDQTQAGPPLMRVAFMGLTGPTGVLPDAWTEFLIERIRAKDHTLHDFLDLFNHRAISLFYRAWEKYRFPISWERNKADRFTEYLFDLIGMGTTGLRGRMSVPDQALLRYGGLIAQRPHSATAVAAILSDHFGVSARIEQFFGQWLKLEDRDYTRLGKSNSQLGVSTISGQRVWDQGSKFRVCCGPLSLAEFTNFLPVGTAFRPLKEITGFLAGQEFDFDLQLVLKAQEVPGCVLTTRARRKPMLGWTTWLKTRDFKVDDRQVVLRCDSPWTAVNGVAAA